MSITESELELYIDGQRANAHILNRPIKNLKEATNRELNKKLDVDAVVQNIGQEEDKVMSQKAVSDALADAVSTSTINSTDDLSEGNYNKYFSVSRAQAAVTREHLNIDNVDNTSDLDKPLSNASLSALEQMVNKSDNAELSDVLTRDEDKWVSSRLLYDYVNDWRPEKELGYYITNQWLGTTISSGKWEDVVYSKEKKLFVAIASTGTNRVAWSTDCVEWNNSTVRPQAWESITYCDLYGLFVAISSDGTDRLMTSSDAITWDYYNILASPWKDILWDEDRQELIAVSDSSGINLLIMEYDENIQPFSDFIYVSIPITGIKEIVISDVDFVAINSNQILVSSDLEDSLVTQIFSPVDVGNLMSLCYSEPLNTSVIVSDSGVNRIVSSIQTDEWTPIKAPAQYAWKSVEWFDELGLFVAISPEGAMVSEDGFNWSLKDEVPTGNWDALAFAPDLARIVSVGEDVAMTSYRYIEPEEPYVPVWSSKDDILEGTDENKHISPLRLKESGKLSETSSSLDFHLSRNYKFTLDGNATLNNPTNMESGQTGKIIIFQSGTHTLTPGNKWRLVGDTVANTADMISVIDYIVVDEDTVVGTVITES